MNVKARLKRLNSSKNLLFSVFTESSTILLQTTMQAAAVFIILCKRKWKRKRSLWFWLKGRKLQSIYISIPPAIKSFQEKCFLLNLSSYDWPKEKHAIIFLCLARACPFDIYTKIQKNCFPTLDFIFRSQNKIFFLLARWYHKKWKREKLETRPQINILK